MAARTWTGAVDADGNNSGNYSGAGALLTSDDLTWNGSAVGNCTFTGALSVKSLTVSSAYTGAWSDGGQTLTLAGGFNFDDSGAGIIAFTGTVNVTATGTWASTLSLNNLTTTAGTSAVTISGTVIVAGTYTNSNTGTVSVYTGTLIFQGNIAGAGTGVFGGGSGNADFQFTGTGDKTFTYVASTFGAGSGTITINKASGRLSLQQNSSWLGNIAISSGELNCNTKTFTMITALKTLTVGGGTFTGSSATNTLRSVNMSSGVFTATSGTAAVQGNFVVSGGTFTHSNGTVNVGLTSTTCTVTCAQDFYNLSVPNAASAVMEFGSNIAVTNNFGGSAGSQTATVDTKGYNLTVTGTLNIGISGIATFKNTGDETIAYGTLSLGLLSNVMYTATSGTRSIRNWAYVSLTINGAGGTFTCATAKICTGTLTMSAGTFGDSGQSLTAESFAWTGGTLIRPFVIFTTGGTEWTLPAEADVKNGDSVGMGTGTYIPSGGGGGGSIIGSSIITVLEVV
jgi:hypothetical protein